MGALHDTTANKPRIAVTPAAAMLDERVAIRLTGCAPGQRVTVRARMRDDADQLWQSHATFSVDGGGAVDFARQAPLAGSYAAVDAMGLFWSMQTDGPLPCIVDASALTVAL